MSLTVSTVTSETMRPIDPVATPPAQPAESKRSPTTEKSETVAQATLPQIVQRPFSELKAHVWTELKKVLDTCDSQIHSKSYWAIDPRQGLINIAKGLLKRTGETQKAQFEEPCTPEELAQKLHHLHDHTIPALLRNFNPLTDFNPLKFVKQTLEAAPQTVSHLTEEVEKYIRDAHAAEERAHGEAAPAETPSEEKAARPDEASEKKSPDTEASQEQEKTAKEPTPEMASPSKKE